MSLEHLCSLVTPTPPHFHISQRFFHHTPWWMLHCVCVCHKGGEADKKGLPRTVKTAQVRTSFFSEWGLDIREDRTQAENACLLVCHTACQSTVHLAAPPPSHPHSTLLHVKHRSRGSCVGLKDLAVILRVVRFALCVLHCSFFSFLRKYSAVAAGWMLLRSSRKWTIDKDKPDEKGWWWLGAAAVKILIQRCELFAWACSRSQISLSVCSLNHKNSIWLYLVLLMFL